MPQCDISLNHIHSSHCQPKIPVHACLFIKFDFNKTPFSVTGTKVLVHETSTQRHTYEPHVSKVLYISPLLEYYHCYKCFVTSTNSTGDNITVDWFTHSVPFTKFSNDTYLRQRVEEILSLLKEKYEYAIPQLTYGYPITNAYIQISQILRQATNLPSPRPPTYPLPHPYPAS